MEISVLTVRRYWALWLLLAGCHVSCAEAKDPPISINNNFDESGGAMVYQGSCQACHMADGRGAIGAGAYPSLASNPRLVYAPFPLDYVLHGHHGMPAVGKFMTDVQVADVINYVRTHFGNHSDDAISPEDVKRLR